MNDSVQDFFNREKDAEKIKNLYLKFFLTILLTNTLTYYIAKPTINKEAHGENHTPAVNKKVIKIRLVNRVPFKRLPINVAIYNDRNSLIARDVIILEKLEETQEHAGAFYFKIEISHGDTHKFIHYKDRLLYAFPEVKTMTKKKGVNYEVNF